MVSILILQVAGGQKRKYSEDARVPADALCSSLESTGSSGSLSSSVESSRSLDLNLDLRPPPSSSLSSSAECDYPTEEEVPLADSHLHLVRLVRLVLPAALLTQPERAPTLESNLHARVPRVLAVVPDQSRVDLYRFSMRLASDLEVSFMCTFILLSFFLPILLVLIHLRLYLWREIHDTFSRLILLATILHFFILLFLLSFFVHSLIARNTC